MLNNLADMLQRGYTQQEETIREYLDSYTPQGLAVKSSEAVRDYILAMPSAISVFSALVLSQHATNELRAFFGLVMAYVVDAEDYLPENVYGFFGYLDDAYLVHSALEQAVRSLGSAATQEIPHMEHLESLFSLSRIVRGFLPKDVLIKLNGILLTFDKTLEPLRM